MFLTSSSPYSRALWKKYDIARRSADFRPRGGVRFSPLPHSPLRKNLTKNTYFCNAALSKLGYNTYEQAGGERIGMLPRGRKI